jgi:hypothetical protein
MRSGLAGRQQGVCGATAAQAACTGKARLKAWEASARTGRTANIQAIFLTLAVLKLLSGWLNTVARCRWSQREGVRCGARCGLGGGRVCMCHVGWLRRRRTGVHGEQGPIKAGGARARAERTLNMKLMSVTVEVSKLLSDSSNDFAPCRESRGGHTMRAGLAGRQQGVCVGRRQRKRHARERPDSRRGGPAHARGAP